MHLAWMATQMALCHPGGLPGGACYPQMAGWSCLPDVVQMSHQSERSPDDLDGPDAWMIQASGPSRPSDIVSLSVERPPQLMSPDAWMAQQPGWPQMAQMVRMAQIPGWPRCLDTVVVLASSFWVCHQIHAHFLLSMSARLPLVLATELLEERMLLALLSLGCACVVGRHSAVQSVMSSRLKPRGAPLARCE